MHLFGREPQPGTSRRRQTGFTLTEVAVAAGVFGIIGMIAGMIVVATLRYTRRATSETEIQQTARLALGHLQTELRESTGGPDGIVVWPAAADAPFEAVGFLSARQEVPGRPFGEGRDREPLWRTAVYYAFDRDRGELRRVAQSWTGHLSQPSFDEVRQGRAVARGIKDIRVVREQDLVRILVDVNTGSRTVQLDTAVAARN
jgi:prepilin-type N-terminal cleavage/methylation domain-containing protein